MMRDAQMDENYFRTYIQKQEKRISQFENVFQTLCVPNNGNPEKFQQCALYLSHFYRDMLSAQYSCGEPVHVLRQAFQRFAAYAGSAGALTWADAIDLLALSILLNEDLGQASEQMPRKDALVCALLAAVRENEPADTDREILFPRQETVFLRCLQGEADQETLREYLQNCWYEDNQDAAWYGAEKRNDGTYCGCWCYLGAAIAKLRNFEPEFFKYTAYFPVDML